ncbi:MAG TPA: ROK family transcriptional regulator [Porphyromonadaceae bacterium]|mgnify:CR=1 FL=1|jgi:glucokinase-like ROK family protein|uniref:ROK family transcriptional regulator n=1 Tax=Limibacterium fermenti TaxID=3229863 RepID=UPI000E856F8E|nr:ROK family transcriptional regulator [Porphyromonadaceae bacterium]HBK32038.1 ROK family transcriptional regulator [Porphyromonadaceae bacterium]HBL32437.1 ROK family transcriptional regulator [Porphyromonadaceae bacterium]HBX45449.1 ROK family transcriptional regulator [Porphyromonadaceae bacterium]HCM22015.1 ROK family transcriptional regulator [Porphyromonadaceae bacterium]
MVKNFFSSKDKSPKNIQIKKDIINHFITTGNDTIAELSKELDLSVPTVTKFIGELTEDGYISEFGKVQTAGGRHPSVYGLNPSSIYFVGVDMTRHHLSMALMDFKGNIVDQQIGVHYICENTTESFDALCHHIQKFIDRTGKLKDKIYNINLNISGRVNPESGHSYSSFYFSEQPITEILSKRLQYKVGIDNDTRAMAYGEYMKGAIEGEKNVIFVNISWGLGIGIIIDGKLYYGKSGFSGEFGHFPAFDNEIICHCGKKGCLETEASGLAIHRMVLERIARGESTILTEHVKNVQDITLTDIIRATNMEDTMCIEILEEVGYKLGKYIAGLINIFNPELLVIGGQVAETDGFILLPIRSAVRKYSLSLVNKDSHIVLSKLKNRAGIIGACMVARSRLFND